jgi:hypothetical protein
MRQWQAKRAKVIVCWQKKLILRIALPRRAYASSLPLSMNPTEVVNGHRYLLSHDLSTSFSFMPLFFLIIPIPASAHTRSTRTL